jgi:hypothetical protein
LGYYLNTPPAGVRRDRVARRSLADVISIHRDAHARRLLEEACQMVLQVGSIPDVLARFTLALAA